VLCLKEIFSLRTFLICTIDRIKTSVDVLWIGPRRQDNVVGYYRPTCRLLGDQGKKWFCYGNKIRTTNKFFVAATKNFAAATKSFVDRTKHFVVVTKYFCYPYFNKWFCWYNKTFYSVELRCRCSTRKYPNLISSRHKLLSLQLALHPCENVWSGLNRYAMNRLVSGQFFGHLIRVWSERDQNLIRLIKLWLGYDEVFSHGTFKRWNFPTLVFHKSSQNWAEPGTGHIT